MTERRKRQIAIGAFLYAALVLTVDCLATRGVSVPFDWSVFYRVDTHIVTWPGGAWQVYGADCYKLIAWFLIPLAVSVWWFPVRWLMTDDWKPIDKWLLGGLFVAGAAAVASVYFIPDLRRMYPSLAALPLETRIDYLLWYLLWVATWLTGWEYLHRYVLVRAAGAFPKFRVLLAMTLIPLSETLYHVGQGKAWIECLGMAAFSVVCTAWVLRRQNILLPVLAHAFIEVGLIAFLLFV